MPRSEGRRTWLGSHAQWFPTALIASSFAVLLAVMLGTRGMRKASGLLALVPWVVLLLYKDIDRMREGRAPFGLLGLVLVVPVAHVAFGSFAMQAVFQAVFLAVLGFYLFILKPAERMAAIRHVRPILPFLFAFVLLIALSYFLSAVGTSQTPARVLNDDPFFVWSFLLGTPFVLVPALVCRSLQGLGWMIRALFAAALVQGAFVLLQVVGIADRLPGSFAQINASNTVNIGETVSGTHALRYMGSFGDYELLAEFCSIVFIIAVGVVVFRLLPKDQLLATVTAVVAGGVALLTGSRAAAISVVGGVLVLLVCGALLPRGERFRRVLRAVVVVAVSISILYLALPESSLQAYSARLQLPSTSLSGPRVSTREFLYGVGFEAAKDMPLFGYGMRMMTEFQNHVPESKLYRSPHSIYLDALLIAGVPGLIALLALLLRLLQLTWRMTFSLHSRAANGWGIVLLAATAVWAANEVKIEFIRYPFYVDMTFLLFGLIAAAYSLGREDLHEAVGIGSTGRADDGRET